MEQLLVQREEFAAIRLPARHGRARLHSEGESINDEWVKANFWMRGVLNVSALVQHETWLAPVLASSRQTNWTSSVGISYQPRNLQLPLHLTRQPSGGTQANGVSAP